MRLRHISKQSLNILSEGNLSCGYITNELNICRFCNLDQWWKVQFDSTVKETTNCIIDLLECSQVTAISFEEKC